VYVASSSSRGSCVRVRVQAYELSVLTNAEVLLLLQSESSSVYSFTTPRLEPVVSSERGKALIESSLRQEPTTDHAVTLEMLFQDGALRHLNEFDDSHADAFHDVSTTSSTSGGNSGSSSTATSTSTSSGRSADVTASEASITEAGPFMMDERHAAPSAMAMPASLSGAFLAHFLSRGMGDPRVRNDVLPTSTSTTTASSSSTGGTVPSLTATETVASTAVDEATGATSGWVSNPSDQLDVGSGGSQPYGIPPSLLLSSAHAQHSHFLEPPRLHGTHEQEHHHHHHHHHHPHDHHHHHHDHHDQLQHQHLLSPTLYPLEDGEDPALLLRDHERHSHLPYHTRNLHDVDSGDDQHLPALQLPGGHRFSDDAADAINVHRHHHPHAHQQHLHSIEDDPDDPTSPQHLL